jgi:tRNA(Ile)-lysidine synthase
MTGPHPDVAAARRAVRRALADLSADALVLVACSGGPDSVALAAATAFVAPRMALRAGAVCIDHGLQPGSARVAGNAVAICRGLGLDPVWSEPVEVKGPGGVEAAARAARYAALEAAAKRLGAAAVLLGHTLDDQAETVLLGLARGSGARSLAGMARTRGIYRRPLLDLRRAQTESVCASLQLGVWADPMNADVRTHRRAAVRHEVIPALVSALGPGAVPALARTADLLRADADLLDALAADLLAASTLEETALELQLDVDRLAAAPPALRARALRAATIAVGSPPAAVGAVHVAALLALVSEWRGQGPLDLPGCVEASRRCGRLMLRVTPTPS